MLLAFQLTDLITVPFGYLLDWLYQFTSNYGVALIIFAVLVKIILFPITAKSKKSMMKMSRLTPQLERIKKKYPDDEQKQSQAMQELYQKEGVNMGAGCLWSVVPLLILLPLYAVVRQPIQYMLHETAENAAAIVEAIKTAAPNLFGSNAYYDQMIAARHIPEFISEIQAAVSGVGQNVLAGMNFDFLGIDLGSVPTFNVFDTALWSWDWAHIGAFLIPCLSAGSQVLSMFISQKMNNSVVTNEKGIQDEEAAKNSQTNQTNTVMMLMMPLMSLWIGFTVPGALSLYWFIQGIVTIVMDVYLTQHYRKIYDAEDAIKLQNALEEEAAEAERERIRAEKRAANPDGITQNTSKKKMQKQQQQAEQAAREAAARAYAAKKGIEPEEKAEKLPLSGIADRPFCKGRNYDPNRYGSHTTEE